MLPPARWDFSGVGRELGSRGSGGLFPQLLWGAGQEAHGAQCLPWATVRVQDQSGSHGQALKAKRRAWGEHARHPSPENRERDGVRGDIHAEFSVLVTLSLDSAIPVN